MVWVKLSSREQKVEMKVLKRRVLIPALIFVMLLASCTFQRTAAPAPLLPSKPVNTSIPVPTRATVAPEVIDMGAGGFNLALPLKPMRIPSAFLIKPGSSSFL